MNAEMLELLFDIFINWCITRESSSKTLPTEGVGITHAVQVELPRRTAGAERALERARSNGCH